MEAIETLNRYGLEITSGMIVGLDTDTEDTEANLIGFVDASNIPMLTMNLLQALPKTPLWDRLEKEERLVDDATLESNVRFLRPHDKVVQTWHRCIAHAYDPERLFARFAHQVEATYAHRFQAPATGKLTFFNLWSGFFLALNVFLRVGILSDYRRPFWRTVRRAWKHRQVDSIIAMGFIARHLIEFSREALRGEQSASFYSSRSKAAERREAMRRQGAVTIPLRRSA